MQAPGPEARELAQRTGTWEVIASFWPSPEAEPMVATGLVAERKMIGLYMEEIMKPPVGSKTPDFTRIAYLSFSRVEGRWQYVSMDTRFPVGIMPAYSFGKESAGKLTLVFEPIAFVGLGKDVVGRMTRSNLVITRESEDHEFVRQYFIASDGTEREWLATQYEYKRKR